MTQNKHKKELINTEKTKKLDFSTALSLAISTETDPKTLDELAKYRNAEVRASVAGNRQAPPETLAGLCLDRIRNVRWRALANPNVPEAVLDIHCEYIQLTIKTQDSILVNEIEAVVFNPTLTEEKLYCFADILFDEYLMYKPNKTCHEGGERKIPGVLRKICRHRNLSEESLTALEAKYGQCSHKYILQSPNCPAALLEILGKMSRSIDILHQVFQHEKTPSRVKKYMQRHVF